MTRIDLPDNVLVPGFGRLVLFNVSFDIEDLPEEAQFFYHALPWLQVRLLVIEQLKLRVADVETNVVVWLKPAQALL